MFNFCTETFRSCELTAFGEKLNTFLDILLIEFFLFNLGDSETISSPPGRPSGTYISFQYKFSIKALFGSLAKVQNFDARYLTKPIMSLCQKMESRFWPFNKKVDSQFFRFSVKKRGFNRHE